MMYDEKPRYTFDCLIEKDTNDLDLIIDELRSKSEKLHREKFIKIGRILAMQKAIERI